MYDDHFYLFIKSIEGISGWKKTTTYWCYPRLWSCSIVKSQYTGYRFEISPWKVPGSNVRFMHWFSPYTLMHSFWRMNTITNKLLFYFIFKVAISVLKYMYYMHVRMQNILCGPNLGILYSGMIRSFQTKVLFILEALRGKNTGLTQKVASDMNDLIFQRNL